MYFVQYFGIVLRMEININFEKQQNIQEIDKHAKVITAEDLRGMPALNEEVRQEICGQITNKLEDVFRKKYRVELDPIILDGIVSIMRVLGVGSIDELKGKKILDLGCGNTLPKSAMEGVRKLRVMKAEGRKGNDILWSQEYRSLSNYIPEEIMWEILDKDVFTFEPWLTRGLHELGAEVTGVDIGNLEGEDFEHYGGVNLLHTEDLKNLLPKDYFDLVHERLVKSSPAFEKECQAEGITPRQAIESIKNVAVSLLKSDGVFLQLEV